MSVTLDEQIADFASLGTVFDPNDASEEATAEELAEILMRQPLTGGPLARITALTRLVRVLKLAAKYVTARRDREADAINTLWSYRRLAELVGVTRSTMQSWVAAGAKARAAAVGQATTVVEPQHVSRETVAA